MADAGFDAIIGNPPWDMVRGDSGDSAMRASRRDDAKSLTRFVRDAGIYRVDALPVGSTKMRAKSYAEVGGGMASNGACAISRLRDPAQFSVEFWGQIGSDSAGRIVAKLTLTRSSFLSNTGSPSTTTVFGGNWRPANSRRRTASVEADGRLVIS